MVICHRYMNAINYTISGATSMQFIANTACKWHGSTSCTMSRIWAMTGIFSCLQLFLNIRLPNQSGECSPPAPPRDLLLMKLWWSDESFLCTTTNILPGGYPSSGLWCPTRTLPLPWHCPSGPSLSTGCQGQLRYLEREETHNSRQPWRSSKHSEMLHVSVIQNGWPLHACEWNNQYNYV